MMYINHYECDCGYTWQDEWSCMCNDRCPECNKEIEPYQSDIVDDNDVTIRMG